MSACSDHAIFIPMQTQDCTQPRDGKAYVVSFMIASTFCESIVEILPQKAFSGFFVVVVFFCLVKGKKFGGLNVRTRWDRHERDRKSL